MTKLLCISGSLRRASSSSAIVATVRGRLAGEVETAGFDIGSLPHYNADLDPLPAEVEALKAAVAEADGLLIVSPEYNYGIPGVLKNAIDWASRPAYQSVLRGKPVLIATVSGGALGGVRAQAQLKYVLNGTLANIFPWQEIVVPAAPSKVKDGRLADEGVETFLMEAVQAFRASLD
jgi:chromate reductase